MNDLVSIITPAYNAAEFLPETLASIKAQTYENWELVIVDDCSTDNTWKIIQDFARNDKRVKPLQNQENSGVVKTRNHALDIARGRYITFLDSDDLWESEKLEKQVKFMETRGYAFSYTAYENFYVNKPSKIFPAVPKMTARDNIKNTAIGILTVMIDRDVVGEFHMPKLNHGEDTATWQEILERGFEAFGLNECLARYRVRENSLSGDKVYAAKKKWKVYREYYHFSFFRSAYYFICYAFNAIKRRT